MATVKGGIAKIIRMLTHSAVHVNNGMRSRFIPGARSLYMVTAKLIPVNVEPSDARFSAQIQ